jgi:hypothetical protein
MSCPCIVDRRRRQWPPDVDMANDGWIMNRKSMVDEGGGAVGSDAREDDDLCFRVGGVHALLSMHAVSSCVAYLPCPVDPWTFCS